MMKKFVSFIAVVLMTAPGLAADSGARGRRTMAAQMVAAPRVSSIKQTVGVGTVVETSTSGGSMASVRRDPEPELPHITDKDKPSEPDKPGKPGKPDKPQEPPVDNREKEKAACLSNNIGVGNTFVWASRFSNTGSYASMVEDIEHPENNTCFVKVEIRSADSRIQVSDIPPKYFEWGTNITCGSWADEAKLRQRILDAKKSARTWGTVAGAVGGAAVGVGIMELFGNRAIGGAVQGQKASNISTTDFIVARLLTFKNKGDADLVNRFVTQAKIIRDECDKMTRDAENKNVPDICTRYEWGSIISKLS